MQHTNKLTLLLLLCTAPLSVACRATGALLGNEYAEPQVRLQWVARPQLDLPPTDEPTVFIRPFKDAVGAGLDLSAEIASAVEAAGYEVTKSRDADYQLVATLRHFDKARSFDGGESAMRKVQSTAPLIGVIAGGAAGSEGGTAGVVIGGILGGAAGTGISAAMENFSKVYEWDMILDLELSERVDGGFEETRKRSESTTSGANVLAGSESGGRETSDVREAELQKEQTHFRNTFRLVVVAYQMKMTREEALENIEPRLESSISSIMP